MPRQLPLWDTILDDLGRPPADRVARALQVGRSTVYRWNAAGSAPRVACLALFWLTRWGHSQVNADAVNDAALCAALARSWREQYEELLRVAGPGVLVWPAIDAPGASPAKPSGPGCAL